VSIFRFADKRGKFADTPLGFADKIIGVNFFLQKSIKLGRDFSPLFRIYNKNERRDNIDSKR
jgi:hypothetical protein